jgi:hypothetical protein
MAEMALVVRRRLLNGPWLRSRQPAGMYLLGQELEVLLEGLLLAFDPRSQERQRPLPLTPTLRRKKRRKTSSGMRMK